MHAQGGELPKGLLVIGQILKPHGVRGEAKVLPETDFPERFFGLKRAFLVQEGTLRGVEIEGVRTHGRYLLVKFRGVEAPEAVRSLARAWLAVPEEEAVPLPPGHYYIHQIIGLRVFTEEGKELGRVTEVMRSPAHDIYVVRGAPKGEILIPAVHGIVQAIDIEAGQMVVRLLPEEGE
ncbi:MAG: ribosome maturation factor RimM [Armatimonadota bacterium]|nr:ribosome maturation factor RimM [Armatimonadota bacterium]